MFASCLLKKSTGLWVLWEKVGHFHPVIFFLFQVFVLTITFTDCFHHIAMDFASLIFEYTS